MSRQEQKMWRSLDEDVVAAAEPTTTAESGEQLIAGDLLKKPHAAESKRDALLEQPQISRRGFMAAAGTAAGALTLTGCMRREVNNILPYVQGPEYSLPGVPLTFATAIPRGNNAIGLLVTSHEGRPTKVEGAMEHPMSRGKTDLRAQATIWDLYDPDRSQSPARREGEALVDASAEDFDAALMEALEAHAGDQGAGLRLLMKPNTSMSLIRVRAKLLERFPQAKVHFWSSFSDSNARKGAEIAFGQKAHPLFRVERAEVLLSIDSDFLHTDDNAVRYAREFGERRGPRNPDMANMQRLYAVESTYSVTGAAADHRLRTTAAGAGEYLKALAKTLTDKGLSLGATASALETTAEFPSEWLDTVADELLENRGRTAIFVGPRQPAWAHALGYQLNDALGASGQIMEMHPSIDQAQGDVLADLASLVDESGSVRTLVVLGGNPAYDAPADVDIRSLLSSDSVTTFHLSTHRNETTELCDWHFNEAHFLEAWGDVRAADGTYSVQQPLIQPLWGGRSALELVAKMAGERNWRGRYVIRKTFRSRPSVQESELTAEQLWRNALHMGHCERSGSHGETMSVIDAGVATAVREAPAFEAASESALEVQFLPHPSLWDGEHSNNLWCLEQPEPMTKLVWDNAAIMSKGTRDALNLSNGDMVRLSKGERSIELPVWTVPGHADNSITVYTGWGRSAAGRYGNAQTWDSVIGRDYTYQAGGFDVHPLRTTEGFGFVGGVSLSATGGSYALVTTQSHNRMEGRPIAIDATLSEYQDEPDFASYRSVEPTIQPIWSQVDYSPQEVATGRPLHKWAMVIDLSQCIGCNACSMACQAENNIPSVGKQEVQRGREMAWMRIDRYYVGDSTDDPQVALQPVGCQHCEEAPCENVCPVNATAHSPEGLNDMAYNRCVGTRYCANNCPYKVRRYNYLDWHGHLDDPLTRYGVFPEVRQMAFNPNVTVRMRGVIEKCSYCVQRIQEAKFKARREHRNLRDGDVVTACQSVCPSGAITFGDLNEDGSQVALKYEINRGYKLLAFLGIQPRTKYLGKIRNPNPHFPTSAGAGSHDGHGGDSEAH